MSARKSSHRPGPARPENEAWCRTILETLPAPVYTTDATGHITWFNRAAAELWGREPELGKDRWCDPCKMLRPDGSPLPPEETPMAVTLREGRAAHGQRIVLERADGTRRHVQPHPQPLLDDKGAVAGAFNVLIDVTHLEEAVQSQRRLALIVESSDDAIVSKDLNGVITSWNDGAHRLFGYTADEVIGKPITIIIPPGRLDEEPRVLARIRAGEKVDHYETIRRRKDGSLVDISLTVSPIVDGQGRIIGASKIARDISDRRAAERLLKEQSSRKDEFLATLAHELRNPLAPLANGLQLLHLSRDDQASADAVVEAMERQLSHLSRLVDDLMEVSRITRGRITLRKEPLRICEIARHAVDTVKPLIELHRHRLELSFAADTLWVDGDATRLSQVIGNLLTNAAKFTPPGGTIRLGVERENGLAVISVKDNGVGIPPEQLPGVFNMFTQLKCELEGASGGLGIGLALVRQLVALHGGTVAARSEGAGRGSEFIVRLPLMAEAPQGVEVAPRRPLPAAFVPQRVLVVDDNRDAAETLAMLLRTLGHDVHLAHNGADALARARAVKPEIVLLDLGMPGMDGYEVASRLRRQPWGKAMRVVAMTGWGQESDRARTAASGFDRHLIKPVAFDSLQEVLAGSKSATRH
jgi:PAS domain S-box-containing protein